MKVFAMVLLAIRNDRFGLAKLVQHDDQLAALDLLDLATQEIANATRELVTDARSLPFAHTLNDSLLRGLNGRAPEFGEVDGNLHQVTDLEFRILEAGFLDRHFATRVGDF